MSNNRQSVSNYVYNKRRNNNSEPVHNESDFDFTQRNDESRNNSSSSMYNSYVSENDYNSYTTGYSSSNSYQNGNTFNNYNQPSQQNNFNNFNNYSQPQQQNNFSDFNNYNQPPQQNSFNNFNNYSQPSQQNNFNNFNSYNQPVRQNNFNNNQSVWQTDFGNLNNNYNQPVQQNYNNNAPAGHNAIEVRLPNKTSLSTAITLISFGGLFILMIGIAIFSAVSGWQGDSLMIVMMSIFFLGFFSIFFSMAFGSQIDRRHNLKVCKTQVRGRLVGYDKRRRSHKHHHYTVYAPKYEIFVNNHYEIRTVDDFEKGKTWGEEINLLVNPEGYEAVPATKDDYPKRSAGEWIGALILAIFIIAVFGYPILMMFQSM